jgi:hypothetical protein
MRPRISLLAIARVLPTLVAAPSPLAGQASDALYARFNAVTGWELRGYSFDSGLAIKAASQWNVPIVVAAPLGRKLAVDLTTHYVSGHIEPSSGAAETLSGFTDTQVRILYTVNRDRLVGTLSFNLPTGMHTVSTSQFQVAAAVGSNYLSFPVWSFGTAVGVTGGVAYAQRVGSWGVGVSGSLRYLGSYEPFTNDTLSYKPGLESRIRAGADRVIGRASRLVLGLTVSSFSTDVYSGSSALVPGRYSPGTRFIGELSFIRVVGRSTLTFSAWDYYRLTGTSNVGPVATTKENVFDGQLRLTYPVAPRLQLEPMVGFRQWSPEDYRGGRLRSGGLLARVGLTDRLSATVSGRYDGGWIFVRGLGSQTSLTGYGGSVLLRFER